MWVEFCVGGILFEWNSVWVESRWVQCRGWNSVWVESRMGGISYGWNPMGGILCGWNSVWVEFRVGAVPLGGIPLGGIPRGWNLMGGNPWVESYGWNLVGWNSAWVEFRWVEFRGWNSAQVEYHGHHIKCFSIVARGLGTIKSKYNRLTF